MSNATTEAGVRQELLDMLNERYHTTIQMSDAHFGMPVLEDATVLDLAHPTRRNSSIMITNQPSAVREFSTELHYNRHSLQHLAALRSVHFADIPSAITTHDLLGIVSERLGVTIKPSDIVETTINRNGGYPVTVNLVSAAESLLVFGNLTIQLDSPSAQRLIEVLDDVTLAPTTGVRYDTDDYAANPQVFNMNFSVNVPAGVTDLDTTRIQLNNFRGTLADYADAVEVSLVGAPGGFELGVNAEESYHFIRFRSNNPPVANRVYDVHVRIVLKAEPILGEDYEANIGPRRLDANGNTSGPDQLQVVFNPPSASEDDDDMHYNMHFPGAYITSSGSNFQKLTLQIDGGCGNPLFITSSHPEDDVIHSITDLTELVFVEGWIYRFNPNYNAPVVRTAQQSNVYDGGMQRVFVGNANRTLVGHLACSAYASGMEITAAGGGTVSTEIDLTQGVAKFTHPNFDKPMYLYFDLMGNQA